MKFYTLYFRNYIFLFIIFAFTMLIISVAQSGIVAAASNNIFGMADIPIGKNTKEPMSKFTISPVKPGRSPKKVKHENMEETISPSYMPKKQQQNNRTETTIPNKRSKKDKQINKTNTVPPVKIPEKPQYNSVKKTISSGKPNIPMLPSFTPENDNKEHIFLSNYFLHLSVGDIYTLGISYISQESAINNINKNNKAYTLDKIDKKIISCNIKETNKNMETKTNTIMKVNNKKNNKVIKNKLLSVKDNCIIADGEGIAVIVFYLKSNPDLKTSCTVKVTE